MAEVPTVEIHSPKDALQKWIINYDDYKPSEHRLWGEPEPSIGIDSGGNEFTQFDLDHAAIKVVDEPEWIDSVPGASDASIPDEHEWIDPSDRRLVPGVTPSHPDFVSDDNGELIAVNIIDPERRTARKEVHISMYDPDKHELWSSHPRFNK